MPSLASRAPTALSLSSLGDFIPNRESSSLGLISLSQLLPTAALPAQQCRARCNSLLRNKFLRTSTLGHQEIATSRKRRHDGNRECYPPRHASKLSSAAAAAISHCATKVLRAATLGHQEISRHNCRPRPPISGLDHRSSSSGPSSRPLRDRDRHTT